MCRTDACLDKAITKGALSRALKTPLPTGLREALGGGLTQPTMKVQGGARGQE